MSKEDKSLSSFFMRVFLMSGSGGLLLILATGILKIFLKLDALDYIVQLGLLLLSIAGVALVLNFIFITFEKTDSDDDKTDVLDDQRESRESRLRKKFNSDDRDIMRF